MKFPSPRTVGEIAEFLNGRVLGDETIRVTGINELHVLESGDIAFVDHEKYYEKILASPATAIIINKEIEHPKNKALIYSDDPFGDFNKLIDSYAHIDASPENTGANATAGAGTIIKPGAYIGPEVILGKDCVIYPNTSIYGKVTIGDRVIIHANTTIGADAFYYQKRSGRYERFHSCGAVQIDDDVEIGAHCTIDRGVTGTTHIGEGTKLDNQVMVGHDCSIGRNCLMAAQTGLAGTVIIEDDVVIWGQAGIATGIRLGKGCTVLAKSGVMKDVPPGATFFGIPAEDARTHFRAVAALRQLPDILRKSKK